MNLRQDGSYYKNNGGGGAASKIADHEYLHTLGPKISGSDTDTNILPVSYAASGKTGEQYLDTGRILPR